MTDKDYKLKKRECWEEFKNEVFNGNISYSPYGALDFIFDRAYALGREKETISQEEIEKAAREAVRKEYLCESCAWKDNCDLCGGENTAFDCCECPADSYEDGFKDGANFTLGKQEKDADTVIQGWVARDLDGEVFLYENKPERGYDEWLGRISSEFDFQQIKWDSEPIECEIIIKRKKNG